jgi:hypothetical protein
MGAESWQTAGDKENEMRKRKKGLASATLLLVSMFAPHRSMAQGKGQAAGPAASSAASPANSSAPASGGSGLQGKSFPRDTWNNQLRQLPKPSDFGVKSEKDIVFVCYTVSAGENAGTPFVLNNTPLYETPDNPGPWRANAQYDNMNWVYSSNHNGHYYQVQGTGLPGDVTGISGDSEPIFPSDGKTVQEIKGSGLTWKDMGYYGQSPFIPRWSPQTKYTNGDLVTFSNSKGHYYEAQTDTTSGNSEPKVSRVKEGEQVHDGSRLIWQDMGEMGSHDKHECTDVTSSRPLLMNQLLVLAIEMTDIPEETQKRFTILNFNTTTQQGSPINVTPVQAGIAAATASGPQGGAGAEAALRPIKSAPKKRQIYYLTWPSLVTGDANITINVNLVYTPVAPALPWAPQTFYPAGSIVMSGSAPAGAANTIGHYYLALNSGTSSDDPANGPSFSAAVVQVTTLSEGTGLTWKDLGPTPPATAPIAWSPNVTYGTGDFVVPPSSTALNRANGHYYRALTYAQSGTALPTFQVNGGTALDGPNLAWTDMGTAPNPAPVAWAQTKRYNTGDLVTPPVSNGHYYRAQTRGGVSGSTPPVFLADRTTFDDVTGTNLSWTDMGPMALNPPPPVWSPNYAYAAGAQVTPNPTNGHYYQAQAGGVTGPNAPAFPVDGTTVAETDGLVWSDSGTTLPTGAKLKHWTVRTPFMVGDSIQDKSTGHYYSVIQAGISGDSYPTFSIPRPATVLEPNGKITWQDLGTTLPSSISPGQPQPADQTVPLITYSFPQAHALSYFALTSGVVVSSIQTRSFVNKNSPTATTPDWTTVHGGPIVDPILALTAYIKPIDAERPWRWRLKDLVPGATIAFSLTNPSANFYFGGSSAVFNRNIQLVYGFSLARVSTLEPASQQFSVTTAVTRQQFAKGAFIGVSFNILGFIQSLPGL